MKIISLLTFSAALSASILLTGCRSGKREIESKDYVSLPLYMAGQEIPGDDQEKYLHSGSVRMYSVGRLVDPGTGTMREAGTVYRMESAPRWNLIPQYDANPESFARKAMQEQYADSMTGHIGQNLSATREVKAELSRTRTEMTRLEKKCAMLQKANEELKKVIQQELEDGKIAVQNMRLMQKYIQKLELRIKDLEMQDFGGRK